MFMKIASIDIGTNTILMLIAEIEGNRISGILRDEHAIARMGKGVDENRCINQEAFERVLGFLQTYKKIAFDEGVSKISVCGTSALRDAANREEFLQYIFDRTQMRIRILSGTEEALMTYKGALWGFPEFGGTRGVLDIGGGSTEIIFGNAGEILEAQSIDIGSVRLTERILRKSPPDPDQLSEACKFARDQVRLMPPLPSGLTFYRRRRHVDDACSCRSKSVCL